MARDLASSLPPRHVGRCDVPSCDDDENNTNNKLLLSCAHALVAPVPLSLACRSLTSSRPLCRAGSRSTSGRSCSRRPLPLTRSPCRSTTRKRLRRWPACWTSFPSSRAAITDFAHTLGGARVDVPEHLMCSVSSCTSLARLFPLRRHT